MGELTLFALRPNKPKIDLPIETQIKALKLPTPEPEYKFATSIGRKWAFDLAWPEHLIAFEIEGGVFGRMITVMNGWYHKGKGRTEPIPPGTKIRLGGGHSSGPGIERDIEKYNHAACLGWIVIRATTRQIRDGIAITMLERAFEARKSVVPLPTVNR